MPIWVQWLGFIVTIIGGCISAFVLYQAYQLKNIFLLKAKLPKLHENLSTYRHKFSVLLSGEPKKIEEMTVLQAEVVSVLKQAKPQLSIEDSNKIDEVLSKLEINITDHDSSWHFYTVLSSLEKHVASSSEDLKWKG